MGKPKCECFNDKYPNCGLTVMSQVKEDPVLLHKAANTLFDAGKYKEAEESFPKAADLYLKVQNYFDSTSMRYKASARLH